MATYYVRKTGSDSNNGNSPGTAWLTLGKALGAAGIASGDTVYVGAGTYREQVTCNLTNPTAETKIIADVTGAYTGDPGEVRLTHYTTNDQTAPPSVDVLTLNGRNFLTFIDLVIQGRVTGTVRNFKLTRCVCLPSSSASSVNVTLTGVADLDNGTVLDSCVFANIAAKVAITLPTSASADYDANIQVKNCLGLGGASALVTVGSSGASSFKGGGVDVLNCTNVGRCLETTDANLSTSIPCTLLNSLCLGGGISANTSGQITEDYNIFAISGTARSNVSEGSNSYPRTGLTYGTYGMLLEVGQSRLHGRPPRSVFEPAVGNVWPATIGAHANAPAVDLWGVPRPAGLGSTTKCLGAQERHNAAVPDSSEVHSGSYSAKITGPGVMDFEVPVDTVPVTLSAWVHYDSNHGTTNPPQLSILDNPALGITGQTVTASAGAVGTWAQLALAQITPTKKGFIRVRFTSRSAATTGVARIDDFAAA